MQKQVRKPLPLFGRILVGLCHLMTGIACCALTGMMVLICLDVLMRLVGYPIKGVYDVVRIAGALTIACALPVTTAVKGHVAIEYFFRKFNRIGRICVDSMMRFLMIGAFVLASYESVGYGLRFLKNGQVTDTIEIPIFWIPWVLALSFAITALVVMFHLIFPGRDLIHS